MSTPHAPDAISYPTIVIGDEEYKIRLDISDVIALQKQGVDILRMTALDVAGPDGMYPSILERTFRIIAQGIHAQPPMNWEQVASKIGYSKINEAARATTEAIKKVAAQISGGAAPVTEQPPSIQ